MAVRLEQLFLRQGPPLVLKRDNGSDLNHQAVDEVLTRHLVIPFNSPPSHPPYNGGMECAVREPKTPLVENILARRRRCGNVEIPPSGGIFKHAQIPCALMFRGFHRAPFPQRP